jgi:hypothetical protein
LWFDLEKIVGERQNKGSCGLAKVRMVKWYGDDQEESLVDVKTRVFVVKWFGYDQEESQGRSNWKLLQKR